jgi:lysozyme
MSINVVVDISEDERSVDFATVAGAGIVGVVHKATEGVGYADSLYAEREQQAGNAGLWWGAYHFGTGRHLGADQADYFLGKVGDAVDTLLVLDLEEDPSGPSMSLQQARDFVARIRCKTGSWPGLYAGHYLRQLLGDDDESVLTDCWLWFPEYASAPTRVPPQWATWTLWQYTDGKSGPEPRTVPGIGPCDRSQFSGDLAALSTLWLGSSAACLP